MSLSNPTSILAPATLAQLVAAGLDPTWYIDRAAGLAMAMQDRFDPTLLGLVGLRGDLAGQGTLTIRVAAMDGVGYSERLQLISSETGRPTTTGYDLGYTTVTAAAYGLGKKETFLEGIIGNPATKLSLDELEMRLPDSAMATLRFLACTTGSGVTANTIGSTTLGLGMDDMYDVRALVVGTPGAAARGRVRITLDGEQFNQLSASARTEPGVVEMFDSWAQAASLQPGGALDGNYTNFLGLGIDIGTTNDVVQSGGVYLGFGGSPGFIGWARASTNGAKIPASAVPVYFPEWGVVIWRPMDGLGNLTNEVMIYQVVGTGLGDPSVYLQFLCRSAVSPA